MGEELSRTRDRQVEAREFIAGPEPNELGPVAPPVGMTQQRLASERVVVAAPMSFAGSAERIWKLTRGIENPAGHIAMAAVAVVLIALAWIVVLGWYIVFGLLVVPYRLIRRGQRKNKRDELRHRELLAAQRR